MWLSQLLTRGEVCYSKFLPSLLSLGWEHLKNRFHYCVVVCLLSTRSGLKEGIPPHPAKKRFLCSTLMGRSLRGGEWGCVFL
jgi:hypothetical protein